MPPKKLIVELGDRGVGDVQEAGPDAGDFGPFFDRVDVADQGDVDLAVQVGDDVGEFPFAAVGAEVDRAFEGLVEQRAWSP